MAKALRKRVGNEYRGSQPTRKADHGESRGVDELETSHKCPLFRELYEAISLLYSSNGGIGEACRKVTRPDPTHCAP